MIEETLGTDEIDAHELRTMATEEKFELLSGLEALEKEITVGPSKCEVNLNTVHDLDCFGYFFNFLLFMTNAMPCSA